MTKKQLAVVTRYVRSKSGVGNCKHTYGGVDCIDCYCRWIREGIAKAEGKVAK